ncbi:sugar-binding transcriptional regulator [Algihabitans albus]|uniref:sugar-binding transcriptional regulator n=1 Tax=Algihabitans albus TaxID=2164067 RepID=UPI0013C2DE79|nr:sugar-binding domain-containing protein [Algihabitans albus]
MTLRSTSSGDPAIETPPEFGGDALAWAAWLYYGEALTQNEVAGALGVSRASVANYLAEARRRGLVTISLSPNLLGKVQQGQALAERFGLIGACVTPPEPECGDPEAQAVRLRRRIGRAAAQMLSPWLVDDRTIGVAWGRTMLEVAQALPQMTLSHTKIVQVSGSSLGDDASSPEACTALFAGRLGARCQNFHAPAVVTNKEICDALLAEPGLRRHFERLRAADLTVFGVGELGPETVWSDTDFLPASVVDSYLAAGSLAILIGRFLDADGREVDGPLSGRQIGMTLEELPAIPIRVCAAGGAAKIKAIRAVLAGGYATHLVTDADTAARLLGEDS